MQENLKPGPIGVFDSGFGGLTILKEFIHLLPEYDYIYLGDNARAPYGTRSYEMVYQYTLECVMQLFDKGCQLVILACNTASAKALRSIQQNDLPKLDSTKRVLGVIRPTAEIIGQYTKSGKVGILGTAGTVSSNSYPTEIHKFYPEIKVFQEACPMWVPLVENNEIDSPGTDIFIKKNIDHLLSQNSDIDAVVLGCTHYPLLLNKIKQYLPSNIAIIAQGEIVSSSLKYYLQKHTELEKLCSKSSQYQFYTTDSPITFDKKASKFLGQTVSSQKLSLLSE